MKLWPALGALLSLLSWTALGPGETPAEHPAESRGRVETGAPSVGGHAIAGERFYVWDEDADAAEDWVRELLRS